MKEVAKAIGTYTWNLFKIGLGAFWIASGLHRLNDLIDD